MVNKSLESKCHTVHLALWRIVEAVEKRLWEIVDTVDTFTEFTTAERKNLSKLFRELEGALTLKYEVPAMTRSDKDRLFSALTRLNELYGRGNILSISLWLPISKGVAICQSPGMAVHSFRFQYDSKTVYALDHQSKY